MNDYTRLFDLLPYQQANNPQEICFAEKVTENGQKFYKGYTTQECINIINQLSKALLKLGVKPNDKIGLISNNRPQWNFVDLAAQQIGAINVPVYPTITESEYKFIFNDAEIVYCFVSDADLFAKIQSIKSDIPSLKGVFTFNEVEGATNWKTLLEDLSADDLKQIESIKTTIKPNDLATIIYTSGTTGNPKGVMLSHNNIISNIKSTLSIQQMMVAGKRSLSFLPLCHSFERMVVYTYMATGMSVYYAETLETIGENLKEVKPQFFTTVPRLLEKVYEKIMEKGNALEGFRKNYFSGVLI